MVEILVSLVLFINNFESFLILETVNDFFGLDEVNDLFDSQVLNMFKEYRCSIVALLILSVLTFLLSGFLLFFLWINHRSFQNSELTEGKDNNNDIKNIDNQNTNKHNNEFPDENVSRANNYNNYMNHGINDINAINNKIKYGIFNNYHMNVNNNAAINKEYIEDIFNTENTRIDEFELDTI